MTARPRIGEIWEGEIVALSQGPAGVLRSDAGVALVTNAVPGERVRARITGRRAGAWEGEVIEVVVPAPGRRTPPCPWVPRCGGCPWQHVEEAGQRAAKVANLRRELHRAGVLENVRTEWREIVSGPDWRYRRRIRLRVDDDRRVGFFQARTHDLVEIDSCEIAAPEIEAALPMAREWARGSRTLLRRIEIASARDGGLVLHGNAEGPWKNDDRFHRAFLEEREHLRGILVFGRGFRKTFGDPRLDFEPVPGVVVRTSGFTQVSSWATDAIAEAAVDALDPRPGERVLELHAGAGNIGLRIAARGASLLAVEESRASVDDARAAARDAGIEGFEIRAGRDVAVVRELAEGGERFDAIVLDPPRSGAKEAVEALAPLAPSRIVYVSCHPATLARDLGILARDGWRLESIQPVDAFPQTPHLETIVRVVPA